MLNIYIIRKGYDNPDSSPEIYKVFSHYEDAVESVYLSIIEAHKELDGESKIMSSEKDRWVSFIKYNEPIVVDEWIQDEVWLIEEHKVL